MVVTFFANHQKQRRRSLFERKWPFSCDRSKRPNSTQHFVSALVTDQSVRFITSFACLVLCLLVCLALIAHSFASWRLIAYCLVCHRDRHLRWCCWSDTKHGQYKLLATPLAFSHRQECCKTLISSSKPPTGHRKVVWSSVCCTCRIYFFSFTSTWIFFYIIQTWKLALIVTSTKNISSTCPGRTIISKT